MFGKKKIVYQMKDTYNSEDLIIANLECISSEASPDSPSINTTTQKYIFEKLIEDDTTIYREVFTGFKIETEDEAKDYEVDFVTFDTPYLINIVPLKDQLPSVKGKISKYDLLFLLDEINTKNNTRRLQIV